MIRTLLVWTSSSAEQRSTLRPLLVFIDANEIKTLNVAGTRASKDEQIYNFVKQTLEDAFCPRPQSGTWLGGPGEG
jgi:hypothetical protein